MKGFTFEMDFRGKRVRTFLDIMKRANIFHGSTAIERNLEFWGKDFKPGASVPLLRSTGIGDKYYMMLPEVWGWRPKVYVQSKQFKESPGLLTVCRTDAYEQHYQEYSRAALLISSYSHWAKLENKIVRYKILHPKEPIMFMPCVFGYNEDKSGRCGFSIYTMPADGQLAEICERRPLIFNAYDTALYLNGDDVSELLKSGSTPADELHRGVYLT